MMLQESARLLAANRRFIPGGVVSLNRATQPEMAFARGQGAYIWDEDGRRYIDYHAAFAPHFLGHNDAAVNEAVERALRDQTSLFGSGTTRAEGRLAELICTHIPFVESVQMLNSGSEATYAAMRLARGVTGREHVIVMQGGYNGWHNDVACNLMTPLETLGPRVSPGEYAFQPISAGIPEAHRALVHPVNFNDLESVEWVCRKYPVACVITEPILQNIGVVQPQPGYLAGLRKLADQYGFVLIFDEVKTGFRHALGGYASIAGVTPDLAGVREGVGERVSDGGVVGGAARTDGRVRASGAARSACLLAGTYNAHPVPTAAAIATIERLVDGAVYRHVEALGSADADGAGTDLRRAGAGGAAGVRPFARTSWIICRWIGMIWRRIMTRRSINGCGWR